MTTRKFEGEESKHNKDYSRKTLSKPKNSTLSPQEPYQPTLVTNITDYSSSHNQLQQCVQNASNRISAVGYVRYDNLVKINLNALSKKDARVLRRKLATELQQVRVLLKKFEASENVDRRGGSLVRMNSNVDRRGGSLVRMNSNVDRRGGSLVRMNSNVDRRGGSLVRMNSNVDRRGGSLVRMNSNVGSVGLSGNNGGDGRNASECVEKEKRIPKAIQNHKKKSKPVESNKQMKSNDGKRNVGQMGDGVVMEKFLDKLLKSCSDLLGKLMKHKFGWVFNQPVDVKGLGLHDYDTIVKHPMDLGTVKTRLNKNWYKSPREFAEDVRLTFTNAMLYNPKGQDVHVMAYALLGMFDEKWAPIEFEYNLNRRFERSQDYNLPTPTSSRIPALAPASAPIQYHDSPAPAPDHSSLQLEARTLESSESRFERSQDYNLPTPTSRRIPALAPASAPIQYHDSPAPAPAPAPAHSSLPLEARTLERSESMTMPVDPRAKEMDLTPTERIGVPERPKTKDPEKRDMPYEEKKRGMTYEEKQRLGVDLQNLPSEKLNIIVQIIKKRNAALFQQEGEIELDIDNVDPETLWELNRFVTNYKKNFSTNEKKAEVALQSNPEDDQNTQDTNLEPPAKEVPKTVETCIHYVPTRLFFLWHMLHLFGSDTLIIKTGWITKQLRGLFPHHLQFMEKGYKMRRVDQVVQIVQVVLAVTLDPHQVALTVIVHLDNVSHSPCF